MTTQNREAVADFISDLCDLLDEENFSDFLDQCTKNFEYSVTAYSPDLGKEMTWLDHDRDAFELMVKMLPEHVRTKTKLSRHASLVTIAGQQSEIYQTKTKVAIYQTDLIGTTTILAVGSYLDKIDMSEPDKPKLVSRHIHLDTRDLGPGVCVPL